MAAANGVSLKEHLEGIFDEFKERYIAEQKLRDDAFDEFKKNLDKEGKILADSYLKDLRAYPSADDFTKLKDTVTTEFGTAVGRAKAFAIGLGILAVLISSAGVIVAILALYGTKL